MKVTRFQIQISGFKWQKIRKRCQGAICCFPLHCNHIFPLTFRYLHMYLSVCSIRECKIFYSNNFSELMHGKVAGGDNKPFVYFSFAEIAQ